MVDRTVVRWLWVIAACVAAMVVVGGITRLSGSGLSITEWRPVTGALPPLDDADWSALFEKYRASPQFAAQPAGFAVEDFKAIFWWEWFHRLLGRAIGLIVLLPFVWFWRKKRLPPWLVRRVVVLFALGGFQGLLGWLMVKSGLVDVPRVSHLRLAAHLMTALFTFSLAAWTALEAQHGRERVRGAATPIMRATLAVLALQLTWGAFVAGLRAGYAFPTFPKMGGDWIPPRALYPEPLWEAALGNVTLVQFIHRWLGALVLLHALLAARRLWRERRASAVFVGGAALAQFALGAITVMNMLRAPVVLGSLHQAGAVVLLLACVRALFFAGHRPAAAPVAQVRG